MQLTKNFAESEFLIHETPPASYVLQKLPAVAALCQWLRDLAGSYGRVTSYYRSPARNAQVGGVTDSQHMLGEAADLEFPLVSLRELASKVQAAVADGSAPDFGQCIFYPDTGETHISLPGATKFQELTLGAKVNGGRRYSVLESLSQLPATPQALGAIAILAIGAIGAFFFPALHAVRF